MPPATLAGGRLGECAATALGDGTVALGPANSAIIPRLVTSRAVEAGAPLISVPPELVLTDADAADYGLGFAIERFPHLAASPPFLLALTLLVAVAGASAGASAGAPLLRCLPTEAQLADRVPLLMRRAALEELRGTDAMPLASGLLDESAQTHAEYVAPICAEALAPRVASKKRAAQLCSLKRWRWSLALVWRCALDLEVGAPNSRRFGHTADDDGDDEVEGVYFDGADGAARTAKVLSPALCAAANAPVDELAGSRARFEWRASARDGQTVGGSDGMLVVRAARQLGARANVSVDFGLRTAAEELVARGDIAAAPTRVTFHVEADALAEAGRAEERTAMLAEMGAGAGLHFGADDLLPKRTLRALAIASAPGGRLSELRGNRPLSGGLELLALAQAAHACEVRLGRYPASLDADEASLAAAPAGSARHAALLLRVGEQRILEAALEEATSRRAEVEAREAAASRKVGKPKRGAARGGPGRGGGDGSRRDVAPGPPPMRAPPLDVVLGWSAREACEWVHSNGDACASWNLSGDVMLRAAARGPAHLCREVAVAACATSLWPPLAALVAERIACGGIDRSTAASAANTAAAKLSCTAPQLVWSQDDASVSLAVQLTPPPRGASPRLPQLKLASASAVLRGRSLEVHLRGQAPLPADASEPEATWDAVIELGLWAAPARAEVTEQRDSSVRVRLEKGGADWAEEVSVDEAVDAVAAEEASVDSEDDDEWPRLLRLRSIDRALRRRGALRSDVDAAAAAIEAEEEVVRESERTRRNVAELEEKWAREGRGTLAEQIGAAWRGDGDARAGDAAGGAQLSEAQRAMLERGEHPSRVPGLEGGVEVELDEGGRSLRYVQPPDQIKDEL